LVERLNKIVVDCEDPKKRKDKEEAEKKAWWFPKIEEHNFKGNKTIERKNRRAQQIDESL